MECIPVYQVAKIHHGVYLATTPTSVLSQKRFILAQIPQDCDMPLEHTARRRKVG